VIKDSHIVFAYEAMVWQCSTEGHEDLFQGNFADNNTHGWRDLWQLTTKILTAEVDGRSQLIIAFAAKVDTMS